MSEPILIQPPSLPPEIDDTLYSYSDYVFASYLITFLVLALLVIRSAARARKARRMLDIKSTVNEGVAHEA